MNFPRTTSSSYGPMDGLEGLECLPDAAPRSPVEAVGIALNDVERLAARVHALAERLLGPSPGQGADKPSPVMNGLLYAMGDHASRASRAIGDAESAISRIERALP